MPLLDADNGYGFHRHSGGPGIRDNARYPVITLDMGQGPAKGRRGGGSGLVDGRGHQAQGVETQGREGVRRRPAARFSSAAVLPSLPGDRVRFVPR